MVKFVNKKKVTGKYPLPVRIRLMHLSYNSNVGSANLAAVLRITLCFESNFLTFFQRLEALSVDS